MTQSESKAYSRKSIREIQGSGLRSPIPGQRVITDGVVTGHTRRGFFIQTPDVEWDGQSSDAIYVHNPTFQAELHDYVELKAKVVDYVKHETARPVTQLHFEDVAVLDPFDESGRRRTVAPIKFTQELLSVDTRELAVLLNSLEAMLIEIESGQTFIAPSNHHGDYVIALDSPSQDQSVLRSEEGGVIPGKDQELRWFPGFRIFNYNHAPRLNVGAKLAQGFSAPLNYRADSYQLAVSGPIEIEESFVSPSQSSIRPSKGSITVMTLNCFNLDPHVESEAMVSNPNQDVDDDFGEGRFHSLARAIVLQANCPDIVALQEIQDNDGAEQTEQVDASETYRLLTELVAQASEIEYSWVDIAPAVGADGGQPGGNIRNGFLYNPKRVALEPSSVSVFGNGLAAFEGSRKPLQARFTEIGSDKSLTVINVHLASKRHQASIFAPMNPGVDEKHAVRTDQARAIADRIEKCLERDREYYVTGDFNDTEHSETLAIICGSHSANLVLDLNEKERYDYNHRGKLQVLMHGVVSRRMREQGAEYEIVHGNELIGVKPGEETDKASDHAYVIARLPLGQ